MHCNLQFLQSFASLHIAGNFQIFCKFAYRREFSDICLRHSNRITCRLHFRLFDMSIFGMSMFDMSIFDNVHRICLGLKSACVSASLGGVGHRQCDPHPGVADTYWFLFFLSGCWELREWTGSCFLHLCNHWQLTMPCAHAIELDSKF